MMQRGLPLYETIYRVLKAQIGNGKLPAGLIIGESDVARRFKASRIPAGAALRRLLDEGLLQSRAGRGYIVNGEGEPLRMSLEDAGLDLPRALDERTSRNRGAQIYPEVEHAVAACLAYGRFVLNESALAAHYQVSRTVAHEVLTRLERTGIVAQDTNQRWYAGPLTPDGIRRHFEMRWLLEPTALRQALPYLEPNELRRCRDRVDAIGDRQQSAAIVEGVEQDLHFKTLAHCPNPLLLETVRRSQLPLLATHSSFEHQAHPEEIGHMVRDHRQIFDALIAGDVDGAAAALEAHLRRSVEPNIELWRQLRSLPQRLSQPYLVLADPGAAR